MVEVVLAWVAVLLRIAAQMRRPSSKPAVYSSEDERSALVRELEADSERRPLVSFSATGHVRGLAGAFPLPGATPDAVAQWLGQRRRMLGLTQDDTLVFAERDASSPPVTAEPYDVAAVARRGATPGEKDAELYGSPATYTFDVAYEGYPHSGMQLTTLPLGGSATLAGVLNTFSPTFKARIRTKLSPERAAWAAAEAAFGTPLEHQEAVQVWFDVSWALHRVSGTQELHWRLSGRDPSGASQYAFVRASDNRVTYHTPLVTSFSVHQTHMDSASNVLWDSQTLPNGCASGNPGCSGAALAESQRSRDLVPKVVDLWYRITQGGTAPYVWPFSGPNESPFDNLGGRAIRVVVADPRRAGLNVADYPTHDGLTSTYTFPEGTVTRGYIGHEYGHALLGALKQIHPGGWAAAVGGQPAVPAASFTEAMADFIGVVTEHLLTGAIPAPPSAAHWMTDFSIGDFVYDANGGVIDSPPVAWDIREGNCTGKARQRLGRAFIEAWGWDVQWYGNRPQAVGEATYRAWWIDIMRSFALLPAFSFPTIKDFYDATMSRMWSYVDSKPTTVAFFLSREMEKLGLDVEGCY